MSLSPHLWVLERQLTGRMGFSTVLPMGRVDMGHEDLSVRWLQSLKSEMSSWISNVSS